VRPRQFWAFCANPSIYRVEQAVRDLETDAWTTHSKPVRAGDWVVIWKSQGPDDHRGVVALGEVLTDPHPRPDSDNPYWVERPPPEELRERVLVRYIVPERLPLWEPDPALEALSVSRARGGTVFRVAPEQWDALVDRVGGAPPAPRRRPPPGRLRPPAALPPGRPARPLWRPAPGRHQHSVRLPDPLAL
jgi:hypothetical protein